MEILATGAPISQAAPLEPGAPTVVIDDLSVEFPMLSPDSQSLRSTMLHWLSGRRLKQSVGMTVRAEALKSIDLVVRPGDRVGLVGRNGAGKSTLLRVLAGVYHPTSGRVTVNGRVSALLGGSSGLEGELSGWQAIDIGCLFVGLTSREIRDRRLEIADFTELGDYLAMPLRTYSSGMRVRLAFAIATSINPDILVMDEVMSAGDAHFLEKSRSRALNLMQSTKVLFLASHSPTMLHAICNKGVLIEQGEIVFVGSIEDVLQEYDLLPHTLGTPTPNRRERSAAIADSYAPGRDPKNAFLSGRWRYWQSARSGGDSAGAAYLGFDFGNPKPVKQVSVRQWVGGGPGTTISRALLQASNDCFQYDIQDVAEIALPTDGESTSQPVDGVAPHRYWRLLAASDTEGGAWSVAELVLETRPGTSFLGNGRAISSGAHAGTDASSVFDGRSQSYWLSEQKGSDVANGAYIGYDFGTERQVEVRRIRFRQRNMHLDRNTVRAIVVESSSDSFTSDIRRIARAEVTSEFVFQVIDCPPSAPARFWRLVADGPTFGGRWVVTDIEFSPQAAAPSTWLEHALHGVPLASSSMAEHPPEHAFEASSTRFFQAAPLSDDSELWIGLDLGVGSNGALRGLILEQYQNDNSDALVDRIRVDVSDDAFASDIRTLAELEIARDGFRNAYELPKVPVGRFVRIVALPASTRNPGTWALAYVAFIGATATVR